MENRNNFDNKSKDIKNKKTLKPLRKYTHTCNLKEKKRNNNGSTCGNNSGAINFIYYNNAGNNTYRII